MVRLPWDSRSRIFAALLGLSVCGASLFFYFDRATISSITLPSTSENRGDILWNVWASPELEPYSPTYHLPADSQALITLHLSSLDYSKWSPDAHSHPSSASLREAIGKLLANLHGTSMELTVVFLADPTFFDMPEGKGVLKLSISAEKIRNSLNNAQTRPDNPFRTLERERDPAFVLAQVSLPIHTNKMQGATAIGISIWEGIRPIDEISLPVCVGAGPCPARQPAVNSSLKGYDSLRTAISAAGGNDSDPDAALHFVDLNIGRAVGVFHRKDWPEDKFETWRLNDSPATLRHWLKNGFIPAFHNVAKPSALVNLGLDLFYRLFPDGPEAATARKEFLAFFQEKRFSAAKPAELPASVFIRMLPQADDPLPILPAGLLAIPLHEAEVYFLGQEFRVETPLEIQDYSVPAACVSDWAMLLPPDTSEWKETRDRYAGNLAQWQSSRDVFDTIPNFSKWLNTAHEAPTVMVTLSHHDSDALYFDTSDKLMSTRVRGDFASSSIAILDGCGTGNIGAVDWVRALNRHHVDAVIVTSTEINPFLAADFLSELDQTIADQPKAGISAALALFKTQRSLSKKKPSNADEAYGDLVLNYSLLGNGSIPLCRSEKRQR